MRAGPGPRAAIVSGAIALALTSCGSDAPAGPGLPERFRTPLSDWSPLQPFGTWNPVFDGYHLAQDLGGTEGTPVRAIADGVVRVALTGVTGYGGIVVTEHDAGDGEATTLALYGHLSAAAGLGVEEGDRVDAGEVIAVLAGDGEDGGPWSPHLHFGMREGPHLEGPHRCGLWLYVGYTRECPGTTHEAFMEGWIDPAAFFGMGSGPRPGGPEP